MRALHSVVGLCCVFTLACGGASESIELSEELSELSAVMDPSGTQGCLADCMKLSTEAMELAEAGKTAASMKKSQESMACSSRCEEGGGRAAASASGVGDNITGCLAECMTYSTKAMALAEAGDHSGSMKMSEEAMACQSRCE